jgi:hypothetical protein
VPPGWEDGSGRIDICNDGCGLHILLLPGTGMVECECSSLGDFETVEMLTDSSAARFRGFVAMVVWGTIT